MKKLYSLIRASMTSGMSLFKVKKNKNGKNGRFLIMFLIFYIMFGMWGLTNSLIDELEPMNLHYIILPVFTFLISIMTFIEGIYKAGPLMFNCKDDDLLLSLPIKKSTVLFVRIFKFYLFELLFNSLFILPVMIAYATRGINITWSYYLTSLIMLFLLPIIPIVLSCIVGSISTSLSSKFKHKNIIQIVISMIFLLAVFSVSYSMDNVMNYLVSHADSINDLISKIYYPSGVYAKLLTHFNILTLLLFIIINIVIFVISILVLSKSYFKINSRMKNVTSNSKVKVGDLTIKSNSITKSLVKKEFSKFFNTPVLVINSGFALVLFLIFSVVVAFKFDSFIPMLTSQEGIDIPKEVILNNKSLLVLCIIMLASFMTSITNSLISLEGRNINILKSLPIKVKTILMSKIYSCLLITTPVLLLGDIILFIRLKLNIFEMLLLVILSITLPLISHIFGLIVNLKYPKLDAENSAEVVKQSTSSMISVLSGLFAFIILSSILFIVLGSIPAIIVLLGFTFISLIADIVLYNILINKGVKNFNELTI